MNLLDICTSTLVTVSRSQSAIDAANLMRESHVGCVIVVDDSALRRPLGIVTDRDIVIKVVAAGLAPSAVLVEQIMSPELVVSQGSTGILEGIQLMCERRGVRRMLVMGEGGQLRGIVSFDDLLPYIAAELNTMAKSVATGLLREEQEQAKS